MKRSIEIYTSVNQNIYILSFIFPVLVLRWLGYDLTWRGCGVTGLGYITAVEKKCGELFRPSRDLLMTDDILASRTDHAWRLGKVHLFKRQRRMKKPK